MRSRRDWLGRRTSDLIILVAGNGSGQALAAALETARRLSSQSPTLLVDLGATQDWFADILDREDSGRIEIPGLADLLAERASFSEVIRRDLSTSLDVIPSGGIVGRGALDVIIRRAGVFIPPSRLSRLGLESCAGGCGRGGRGLRRHCRFARPTAPNARRIAPRTRRRRRRAHWICGAPLAPGLRRGGLTGRGANRLRRSIRPTSRCADVNDSRSGSRHSAGFRHFSGPLGDQVDEKQRKRIDVLQDGYGFWFAQPFELRQPMDGAANQRGNPRWIAIVKFARALGCNHEFLDRIRTRAEPRPAGRLPR